jgi:hypothetical protein
MGMNIIDKISEFTFGTGLGRRGEITISAEQLRGEKCRYSFKDGDNEVSFFGRMSEFWQYGRDGQKAILRTLDGRQQSLPASLYVVEDIKQEPTERLGAYLPTVSTLE